MDVKHVARIWQRLAALALAIGMAALALPVQAALVIDRVSVQPVDATTDQPAKVILTWFTNQEAMGRVDFGTTSAYGQYVASSDAPTTLHEVTITGLVSEATYHFKLNSRTFAGESIESFDQIFKAPKWKDTTAPLINTINISFTSATYAIFTFNTNEPTSSEVQASPDPNFKKNVARGGGPSNATTHEVVVRLTRGLTYYYRIKARDKDRNETTIGSGPFSTAYDDSAEKSNLRVFELSPISLTDARITDTTLTFHWRTSRPAKGGVQYRSLVKGTKNGQLNETGFYATEHEVKVVGLRPNTQYLFKVSAKDVLGKSVTTSEFSVATRPGVPPVQPRPSSVNCRKTYAYGVCRDLTLERQAARDLTAYLRGLKLRLPSPLSNSWSTLVRAFTYGGYPADAVAQAIRHGGKTVHPTIPWEAWQYSAQYKEYISK